MLLQRSPGGTPGETRTAGGMALLVNNMLQRSPGGTPGETICTLSVSLRHLPASTKPRRNTGGDRTIPILVDCLGEARRVASPREKSPSSQAKQPVLVRRLSKNQESSQPLIDTSSAARQFLTTRSARGSYSRRGISPGTRSSAWPHPSSTPSSPRTSFAPPPFRREAVPGHRRDLAERA